MSKELTTDTARTPSVPAEPTYTGPRYVPQVDILEDEDSLTVLADLPGVDPKDVDVRFENGLLTIWGRVKPRQPEETAYLLREYGVGDFHRTFEVSEAIDASRITAEYANGVLTLRLPKAEAARPRKIEVKAR